MQIIIMLRSVQKRLMQKEYDTTVVHLDGFMMGAGSNACGPVPDAEHRMPKVKEYSNNFTVKPVGSKNV